QDTLAQVKGQIATLVAQEQAAQAAAQQQAFEARVAAEAAAQPAQAAITNVGPSASGPVAASGGGPGSVIPPSGSGGAAAVAAAESQLGVPYVWGGETPGVGFDCSGLTQWAWGQAGVGIPRTAQEQYDAIAHISLSDLEPGDLLFWGDGGGIYHVAMYVGGGDVIQAPETGETVSIAPIWNNELVGAGRP
ncbi:MAG TPA: C40 family peptidase, partial [Acidimicrobiales bacterium]|nr:C40 family peptidase [Acidimicrobiales bacterium]